MTPKFKYVPGLYFRYHPKNAWNYFDIGESPNRRGNRTEGSKMLPQKLPASNIFCFDKLYTRKCKHCFFNSITKSVATKFKKTAYTLTNSNTRPTVDQYLRVLIARRNGTREMTVNSLKKLTSSIEDLNTVDKKSRLLVSTMVIEGQYSLAAQVRAVTRADVVITTHGGFESNLIFMRGYSYECFFLFFVVVCFPCTDFYSTSDNFWVHFFLVS